MSYTRPVLPVDLEMHVMPVGDGVAVYQNGNLADCGHLDDVQERLIKALDITVEHDSDPIIDKSARGWSGTARTLDDLHTARKA